MKQRILFVFTFVLCLSLLANAQTIADLARRERARVKAMTKPPTYTTEMVKKSKIEGLEAEPVQPPPKAEEKTAPAADAAAGSTAEVRDEKWWRGRFDTARSDIQRLESQTAVMESDLRKANLEALQVSYDPTGQTRKNVTEATSRLDVSKKELDQARTKVTQLEDELRRSGAPASWAR